MTTILRFGQRWRGKTIADVVREDPSYVLWLLTVPAFGERHPLAYGEVRRAAIALLQAEEAEDLAA